MKIVFFGNSLVEGNYGGNFVAEVAARLPNHAIINEGRAGNTILNLLDRLEAVLASQPDGVFTVCAGNDAISYSQTETRRYYQQVQRVPDGVVTPEQFAPLFRELLTRLQLAHVLAWVALAPIEYNPDIANAMQQYNSLISEVAYSLGVPTLDLTARLAPPAIPARPPLTQLDINQIGQRIAAGWNDYEAERERGGYTYTFDGLHFTPQTAEQVAVWIVEFMALT